MDKGPSRQVCKCYRNTCLRYPCSLGGAGDSREQRWGASYTHTGPSRNVSLLSDTILIHFMYVSSADSSRYQKNSPKSRVWTR
jgi:hypothetical protein